MGRKKIFDLNQERKSNLFDTSACFFCSPFGKKVSKDDDQHPPDVNKPIDRKTCGLSPSQNSIAVDQIEYIVVDHSGGEQCFDLKSCCKRVLDIQRRDVNEDGLADIRYNFLIGTDGTIYQGRGFEHANDMSPRTLNVAMIGDFTEKRAPNAMMEAVNWLVLLGLGKSPMAVGTMDIICYNQIRSIGNQRTDDSQLCRDIANSDSIRMYYADAILNITDGRIYPD
ncbi:hypothetical protein GWI33_018334 [Rhynchophorus ferrugineus]|uniref:Peptidoglycan recognition protein family domain-containing protein n=1 Tax=Rhynchophorus ferrugineus TaxID=354439 RepID=A0A834M1M4_RHYFE|nr:hypothetical protein GWI33_018334 [Rhynchophorus ferrugineus]